MRVVCRMGREILDLAALAVRPGVRCEEIDTLVHEACMERKCYPSPLNYRKFPKSVCTSVNEVSTCRLDPVSTLNTMRSLADAFTDVSVCAPL
jgi:methionine aminopeptidase